MAEGKWIHELTATTPVAKAAGLALRVRLQVVQGRLEPALRAFAQDPEHVHQLRVATRRVVAALDVFALVLPGPVHARSRRRLCRLRRVAGDARDWDVFHAAVTEHLPVGAGRDFLHGYATSQRLAAQDRLLQVGERFAARCDRFTSRILDKIREPHAKHAPRVVRDLAEPHLSELLGQFHAAAERDLDNFAHLHQVRILGKRLRYSLELFGACFAEPVRDTLYPAVVEMQEILGRANDSQVGKHHVLEALGYLRSAYPAEWRRLKPALESLRRFHQRRLPREKRLFQKWYRDWRQQNLPAELSRLLAVTGCR